MHTPIRKLFLLSLIALCPLARGHAHPFEAGSVRLAAGGGGGVGGWSASLAGGYFIRDGLELGLGTTYIKSDETAVQQLTMSTTYVFLPESSLNPSAGVFFRHWFILDGDLEPASSTGLRLGAYYSGGGGLILGGHIVYERIINCKAVDDCESLYPEFSLAIVF